MSAFIAPAITSFSATISGARVCTDSAVTPARFTMKKSAAMPFMNQPAVLDDDSIAGNAGFDPFNLSTTFNFKFMQEAEIKHCRVAMLGALGMIFPEIWRFPGVNAMSPQEAHDFFVKTGGMSQILLFVSFFEIFGAIALKETLEGERPAGYFGFDPLGLGKNPDVFKKYQLSEIKNGRLAMIAVGGIYHASLVSKTGVIDQLVHFKGIPVDILH
eukprot:GFKZ01009337.1.p1 GENE.GFKZ01009337.1~~GFKZ01009337.1.p1  ORF type:complete len:215 (+),score=38.27 GFKZ01009337.1:284-928(+)